MEKNEIEAVIDNLGLSITSVFVPFSQSRNSAEKYHSLNWSVTLCKNGKPILTTDYGAGCAHCPSYQQFPKDKYLQKLLIAAECETGKNHKAGFGQGSVFAGASKAIKPDPVDVIYSLVMDADVLNYSNFEDWASSFGYETDSRKAESIYRACIEIALALRNAIGEKGLQQLNAAFQDY